MIEPSLKGGTSSADFGKVKRGLTRIGGSTPGGSVACWSTGGAAYARESAVELGLADCFVAFLPKPTIILDDQPPAEWRLCRHVHPFNVASIETEA